jgi:hypothetical protein
MALAMVPNRRGPAKHAVDVKEQLAWFDSSCRDLEVIRLRILNKAIWKLLALKMTYT